MVFAAAATAIVSIGVTFSSGGASHPGGDPTGSVLRALETDVSSALAPNTHVVRSRPEETRWLDGYEACDGHVGWLPVTTEVMFTSPASTARVFETADATLTRQGWTSTSTADSMDLADSVGPPLSRPMSVRDGPLRPDPAGQPADWVGAATIFAPLGRATAGDVPSLEIARLMVPPGVTALKFET